MNLIIRRLAFAFFVLSIVGCASRSSSESQLATNTVKLPASITLYFAELIASDDAENELEQFRTGQHKDQPSIYLKNSEGLKELLAGDYYQKLSEHLIKKMAEWYGGTIPNDGGIFLQSDPFRPFSPSDAFWEMLDGIDMADVIGSITHLVRLSTKGGKIYFMAINDMSLESYAGENYLRHGLIKNPQLGKFRSTSQVFIWSVPIPQEFQQSAYSSD